MLSSQMHKHTGKKSYMLSARDVHITWGDNPAYWTWKNLPESGFPEVAVLNHVWWFHISGGIDSLALSPNTQYAAFLVFKMINARGFDYTPVVLSVGFIGGKSSTKKVCLDPSIKDNEKQNEKFWGLQRPDVRSDGWLEIEMGEFFNSGLENKVEMKVRETSDYACKSGFYLEGIEIRPKSKSRPRRPRFVLRKWGTKAAPTFESGSERENR